ncbi:hypothetical protein NIES19_08600 [Anabaena cylindrica PCC 7122]|nr:hypothetical protein NIES19_08600 [Anabaena cylindrica PCC 7122]
MSQIQELHQQAMNLAEMTQVAKLRSDLDLAYFLKSVLLFLVHH